MKCSGTCPAAAIEDTGEAVFILKISGSQSRGSHLIDTEMWNDPILSIEVPALKAVLWAPGYLPATFCKVPGHRFQKQDHTVVSEPPRPSHSSPQWL